MRQTGNDNLIWHLSCKQDDQILWIKMNNALELWISTEFTPKNRFYKAKMKKKWNVWVYSIGLWICLPWDVCALSWDLRGLLLDEGEGCPMLWQIYAWHCIVMKILYKNIRIKNKKYNEKLNKAMRKFVRVLDKYGWVGRGGGYVRP